MATDDLYHVRFLETFLGKNVETTYFIEQTVGTGNAENLKTGFRAVVIPLILAVQVSEVASDQVIVVNLDDVTDFGVFGVAAAGAGSRVGDSLPPFATWSFVFGTTNRLLRSGSKRVPGVAEGDQVDGLADGTIVTALATLADAYFSGFVDGVNQYEFRLHTEGNVATSGAPLTVPLASVSYSHIGTQNSRKFA